MRKIVLGLGGNIGDVKSNLNHVIKALEEKFNCPITKSSFYKTKAIDILFYGNTVISSNDLIIPHPQLQNRNFVLSPMAEILPNFVHPTLNKPISELLKTSTDNLKVERN